MSLKPFHTLVLLSAFGMLSACDKLDEALMCAPACENVQTCGDEVSPPTMDLGIGDLDLGVDAPSLVDCAVNCTSANRVTLGYSDCQIECIESEACGDINGCWNVRSDVYAKYCAVDTTPIAGTPSDSGEEPAVAEGPFRVHPQQMPSWTTPPSRSLWAARIPPSSSAPIRPNSRAAGSLRQHR